ncbi:MAG: hypothetical protein ACI89T_002543 [Cognaticolwellia sp.]
MPASAIINGWLFSEITCSPIITEFIISPSKSQTYG